MTQRVIGSKGSRRRHRLSLFLPFAAIAALVLAIGASAGPISVAAGFQGDDGNLVDDGDGIDWNSFDPVEWDIGTAPYRQAAKSALGWDFLGLEDAQATNTDSAFAGGTKQDHNCPTVNTGKAPNKDDLERVYLASKVDSTTGNVYLALAWVRIPQNTTSPSAHIGFEFNKATSGPCGATSGGLVQRTEGDLLFVYDFEGGTTDSPTITLREWVASGSCEVGNSSPPCWGPAVNLTASGFAEARVNTSLVGSVTDALAPPAPPDTTSVDDTLGVNEFGEAVIDLTGAGVFEPGTCESFGKAYAVSRSSGNSANAQMKDIAGPGDFSLQNCGTIIIKKRTDPRGVDQDFGFTSNIAGSELLCSPDTTPASFTLNDAAGSDTTPPTVGNTLRCDNVPAGTYTVTEGADPPDFEFVDVQCTSTNSGTSTSTLGKTATITLAGGGSVTCVYTNRQQLGAILVTKTRKHAASGTGDHPHAGVDFTVDGVTKTTDANGQACFDGLSFDTYTVTETVPAGYVPDATSKDVTVDNNASCSDDPFGGETVSFHNTPLTNITVSVDSQVDGGTASTIECVDSGASPVFSGSTGPNGDGSATGNDLEPDTYVCTIVVDP
ncbi:MAG TPA: prealbumin-like fold domain-containing protein [Gaiellaceae bacterium]|nr:prealbumin-like fold domain-containing protein [Gaiellaceae bacterium]